MSIAEPIRVADPLLEKLTAHDLRASIEDSEREVVLRLLLSAQYKDDNTGGHCFRIGAFAAWLAQQTTEGKAIASKLFWAAPLHDIGKIGVPDDVLKKPARLTSNEWSTMRQHAEIGASLLAESSSPVLQMASIVACEHHEKFDGSGYPRGIAGDDIFLGARIVSLVDFFDALTSDRCYRKALPDEHVLSQIKLLAGSHLDPELVEILLNNIARFLDLRDELRNLSCGGSVHYRDLLFLANTAATLVERSLGD
ncbi:HD-GYP domain-containing protein [Caballeronia calidae]|uniref:HD-GYP domain-containing protein n=1 Tax=Caballeronia calidae TaxID=1777139 RepID=UPI0012FD8EF6|nr:HD domain-containing phosphohydrolase [Caballeronia calidae]